MRTNNPTDDRELMQIAIKMREKSYSPYSSYSVGAALMTKSGKIYTGCNIETSTLTPTICAERNALFKAVSEGETEFVKIAVTGGKHNCESEICAPCGVCRQALAEFCSDDFIIILGNEKTLVKYSLEELLPLTFRKDKIM